MQWRTRVIPPQMSIPMMQWRLLLTLEGYPIFNSVLMYWWRYNGNQKLGFIEYKLECSFLYAAESTRHFVWCFVLLVKTQFWLLFFVFFFFVCLFFCFLFCIIPCYIPWFTVWCAIVIEESMKKKQCIHPCSPYQV